MSAPAAGATGDGAGGKGSDAVTLRITGTPATDDFTVTVPKTVRRPQRLPMQRPLPPSAGCRRKASAALISGPPIRHLFLGPGELSHWRPIGFPTV